MLRRQPRKSSAFALLAGALLSVAALRAAPVDFGRDIQPILAQQCYDCHGPDKVKGELRLVSREQALRGGASGTPSLVPGEAGASELYQRLVATDDEDRMPQKADPLPAATIALIKRWIEEGATWPDDLKHWAYVAPRRPAVPGIADATVQVLNPIDAFVAARLARERLPQSPLSDRPRWLRRVSLDLTGLPPTPAEVAAFVADQSSQAWERVVDRLLASPHYGERWARPWLDLARYADSHGFQPDDLRDLWPYRDWVIRALNADMPFDRFTVWQLAGDLLPENRGGDPARQNVDALVATGFHRASPTNLEDGADQEETRINQVFDRANTTATVWLGSTLECAQCHNHKYDPFTQREYYQLFAYFNNTPQETELATAMATARLKFLGPYLELPDPASERERSQLESELSALNGRLAARKSVFLESEDWEERLRVALSGTPKEPAPAAVAATLQTPIDKRNPAQIERLQAFALRSDPESIELSAQRTKLVSAIGERAPPRTLVMRELPEKRDSVIFERGSFLSPGERVEPGTPAELHPGGSAFGGTRLELARWLVSPENPLVARVTVNRWWAEFFGRGIVSTSEDFGVKGELPTHPELLDWLAVEFMESGWSMKHVHRLIALSATYRQGSRVTPELLTRDAPNKLFARGPRFRLDAETIRDNALAIAGLLSLKIGGPPTRPYQPGGVWDVEQENNPRGRRSYVMSSGEDQWRRGVYTVWKRSAPYPSFVNFDATARSACTVQRSRSNTPLQALTLLNDRVYVEASFSFARRVLREMAGAPVSERLQHAFALSVARPPSRTEVDALADYLRVQTEVYTRESTRARELVGRHPLPEGVAPAEFAAWQAVAAVLLNLDETITKN